MYNYIHAHAYIYMHACFQTAPKRLMHKGASVKPTQPTADEVPVAQVKKESQKPSTNHVIDYNELKIIELEQQIKNLQKELDGARKQQEQERQEHQILLQEVEADLKSEKKLVEGMKQLEQEREETQLLTEVELSHARQLVDGLEKKIEQKRAASEDYDQLKNQPLKERASTEMAPICQLHVDAEQQAIKQPSYKLNQRLLELVTENAQLKKKNKELQECHILAKDVERRDQSLVRSLRVPRPMSRTYTIRNRSDVRRISGQHGYVAEV